MAAVKELLRAENDGTLSFGDYTLASKTKKDNYEFAGDLYKVKTFSEITKLEKKTSGRRMRKSHLPYRLREMSSSLWSWSRRVNTRC